MGARGAAGRRVRPFIVAIFGLVRTVRAARATRGPGLHADRPRSCRTRRASTVPTWSPPHRPTSCSSTPPPSSPRCSPGTACSDSQYKTNSGHGGSWPERTSKEREGRGPVVDAVIGEHPAEARGIATHRHPANPPPIPGLGLRAASNCGCRTRGRRSPAPSRRRTAVVPAAEEDPRAFGRQLDRSIPLPGNSA